MTGLIGTDGMMLCYAVLCCAVLRYVVLCLRVVPCACSLCLTVLKVAEWNLRLYLIQYSFQTELMTLACRSLYSSSRRRPVTFASRAAYPNANPHHQQTTQEPLQDLVPRPNEASPEGPRAHHRRDNRQGSPLLAAASSCLHWDNPPGRKENEQQKTEAQHQNPETLKISYGLCFELRI